MREKRSRAIINTMLSACMSIMLLLSFAFWTFPAFAAPGDNTSETGEGATAVDGAFEVMQIILRATVNKDHSYEVEETISVNLPADRQSIKFSIPSGNFRISDLEVEHTSYTSKRGQDTSTISIIEADKLTQGTHSYNVKYVIKEFDDNDASKDMFYFNALLPEWRQPIGRISIMVEFPEDFPWDDMQCYAGQFGMQDVNNRVTFTANEKTKTVIVKGERIPENYGITLKAELPDGYWTGALNGNWVLATLYYIMVGVLAVLSIIWAIGGKDPGTFRTKELKPIEGVHLSELGYIFNDEVGIRDMLQLLIYFGRKGYLKIVEYEPKKYRVYRREDPVGEEKLYRTAYNIFFEDIYKNRAVEMDEIQSRLARVRDAIEDDIAAGYSGDDNLAFTPISRIFRYAGIGITSVALGVANAISYRYQYLRVDYAESIAIALIFAGAIFFMARANDKKESSSEENNILVEGLAGSVGIGVILYVTMGILERTGSDALATFFGLAALAAFIIVMVMRARGRANARLVARIRSLRSFISHPTDEMINYGEQDPDYYYDMLQYALSSSGEEAWAMTFMNQNVPEPDWFSDEVEGHAHSNLKNDMTTLDYARSLKSFIRTIENAYQDERRRARRR